MLDSAEKHSSDLLNQIIDHAHLTGRDYLMALEATRARDAAVRRALLDEVDELTRKLFAYPHKVGGELRKRSAPLLEKHGAGIAPEEAREAAAMAEAATEPMDKYIAYLEAGAKLLHYVFDCAKADLEPGELDIQRTQSWLEADEALPQRGEKKPNIGAGARRNGTK